MAKFIQICASQNDVFALDEEGDIYQYHFNVKTWVKLADRPCHASHLPVATLAQPYSIRPAEIVAR